jgi:hypothetical protein
MAVYPDGDALSDRERRILEQIERDIEVDQSEILDVLLVSADLAPLQFCALYLLLAEVALALAAYMSMTALTTIGSTMWRATMQAMRASTPSLLAPGS